MMLVPRRDDFDLFNDFFEDGFFKRRDKDLMKTDIKEKKDKYSIEMDLPGYKKEDIKVSLKNGYLEIHATIMKENNTDEEEKYVRQERFFGECSRSFYVGKEVSESDICAEFKDGILKLEIPKKEEKQESTVKQIEIK